VDAAEGLPQLFPGLLDEAEELPAKTRTDSSCERPP